MRNTTFAALAMLAITATPALALDIQSVLGRNVCTDSAGKAYPADACAAYLTNRASLRPVLDSSPVQMKVYGNQVDRS